MASQQVEFPGSRNVNLAGLLEQPAAPRGWALFAHCFTCSKDNKAAFYIARALVDAGFGVLRFDFTGLGDSEGDFSETNFTSNIDDVVAAADWLREHHSAPALLIGHSLGGAAILAAAHRVPDAAALATLGAPFEPSYVTRVFGQQLERIEREGEAEVTLGGRNVTIRRDFLEDVHGQQQGERIQALGRPLMVLHAPNDDVVAIDNATDIFKTASHPKSFVSLDEADHLLSAAADAWFAADVIAGWARHYLGESAQSRQSNSQTSDTTSATSEQDDGAIRVMEKDTGTFTMAVSAWPHSWLADEAESAGGDDRGPNPYQMLNAALGACTAITLRMYAQRKEWPVKHIGVTLKHSQIYAQDCKECESRSGRIDHIERHVHLDGDLDDNQRERLLEIADRCPVHRTLHSEMQIMTQEADD